MVSKVENYESRLTVSQIPRNQAAKSLLAGCIPKLQTDCTATHIQVFRNKINAYGGVVSWVELILDESVYDGTFSYGLIANEDELKLEHIFFTSGKTDLFIFFFIVFFLHA